MRTCTRACSIICNLHITTVSILLRLISSKLQNMSFTYLKSETVGKLVEASQCAASYLLFYPDHEEMLNNVEYYKEAYKGKSKKFLKPRQVCNAYFQH